MPIAYPGLSAEDQQLLMQMLSRWRTDLPGMETILGGDTIVTEGMDARGPRPERREDLPQRVPESLMAPTLNSGPGVQVFNFLRGLGPANMTPAQRFQYEQKLREVFRVPLAAPSLGEFN